MIRRLTGEGGALVLLACLGALLLLVPLGRLALTGLAPGGVPDAGPLIEALGAGSTRRALVNSLVSAGASSVLATLAGGLIALAIGLTDIRGRGVLTFLVLLPMMIPPHVTAIAWIQATGPASPLLLLLGLAPAPGSENPLYSAGGVIALLSVQNTGLTFLVVRTGLRALPRDMSEAARVFGAGPGRMLSRVVLPLVAPSLIAALALAFVSGLGNFGIPALLGIPARFTTLPVLIWRRLTSFGPGMLPDVAVLAVIIGAVALLAVLAQRRAQARAGVSLTGAPQPALALRLGGARPFAEAALWAWVAATLALPLAALVSTALVPAYGVRLSADTATLESFREVLFVQEAPLRAFANSTLLAGVAAALLAATAVLAGYFASRPARLPRAVAGGLSTLADLAYAIPGLVISIAMILVFLRPLPVLGVSLYGTGGIILAAYLTAFMAIALKPVAAAYARLDPALDDAARTSGAGFSRRMRRILGPLTAPAAASGAILVFLTAYNEVTVSALLWSTGNETIGTAIFNYEDSGATPLAAAMSVITVLATLCLMLLLDRLGRRAPPGVVPWRD
ncbi:ABC transporter permease [Paroceanicella profunda]|uniref:ABC transporter permease n=1 Tax=Paroceanicella profunda TaxID=2579971 RepID=UPI0019811299|nr:iron ABC transporter permease [Paroceanicella profunda]